LLYSSHPPCTLPPIIVLFILSLSLLYSSLPPCSLLPIKILFILSLSLFPPTYLLSSLKKSRVYKLNHHLLALVSKSSSFILSK
jgi:hypothetical protein